MTIGDYAPGAPASIGWQCPVCGAVYAPHVDACCVCGPRVTLSDGSGWIDQSDMTATVTDTVVVRHCLNKNCPHDNENTKEAAVWGDKAVWACRDLGCNSFRSEPAPTYTGDWEPPIELVACSECGGLPETRHAHTGMIGIWCPKERERGLHVRLYGHDMEKRKMAACLAWNELHGESKETP